MENSEEVKKIVEVFECRKNRIKIYEILTNVKYESMIIGCEKMSEVELVKISPRGQIVIPKDIREILKLEGGERLVVKAQGGVILLKKVEIPELKKSWNEIFEWGESFAKEKKIKEEDIGKIVHMRRGVKG